MTFYIKLKKKTQRTGAFLFHNHKHVKILQKKMFAKFYLAFGPPVNSFSKITYRHKCLSNYVAIRNVFNDQQHK